MRQKIKAKNLKYSFLRVDKEKNIELIQDGGWHFNNIMSSKDISLKLKTFAHTEFNKIEYLRPKNNRKKNRSKKIKVLFKWIISLIGLSAISIGVMYLRNDMRIIMETLAWKTK